MERLCPNCYEKWAAKEGARSAKRIGWGAKVLRQRILAAGSSKKPRLVHVVVSIRDCGSVERQRQEAYKIAKSHGIEGGSCVYHPFRRDKWDGQYTLQDCVHFHIVGIAPRGIAQGGTDEDLEVAMDYLSGRLMDIPMIFMQHRGMTDWTDISEKEKEEWVERVVLKSINRTKPFFKHIPDEEYSTKDKKDYRGMKSARAVKRCIQYQLTHCGLIEGTHALTWWGTMSYRSLSDKDLEEMFPESTQEDEPAMPECPVCGSRDTEPCEEMDWTCGWRVTTIENHPPPLHSWDEQSLYEKLWIALERMLLKQRGPLDRTHIHAQLADVEEELEKLIAWNIKSGRLLEDPDGRISIAPRLFDIDMALMQWRFSWGEKGDWRLGRMIRATGGDQINVLVDQDYVHGSLLERFSRSFTCI